MRKRQKDGKKVFKLILYWLPFIGYTIIFSPSSIMSFIGFYFLLCFSLLFTLKEFFSFGRTTLWIGVIVIYLALRQSHIDNILNILILLGILVTFEIYFRKT